MTKGNGTTAPQKPITKTSMIYWAFHGNFKLQVLLFFIIVAIVFARVIPLEMQKRVINEAIALKDLDKLILYCGVYLLAVTAAGLLKFATNYIQAVIGERAMLAMREGLYNHIITLPLSFFRKTQPGMVVSALMTELSAAGTFAGMAFAVPITNVLTLLAFATYLAWLHTPLALLTLVIYPVVIFVLPLLQKKANKANKERVDLARKVSSHIAESVTGVHEVQVHGAYQQENRKFLDLTTMLKVVRTRWSLLKFTIKTTNNYFVNLGPFLVFIYGGFLVMHGELELGAMVAFLSAQEKLYDPWKELINFYQTYQDASIRYKRTMEYFDIEPEFMLTPPPVEPISGKGAIHIKNLSFETPEGKKLLNNINLNLKSGEHMALVGFSGSGKSTLIQCMAKMYQYTDGKILLDGDDMADISKNSIVDKVGYISQRPFIFTGTVIENLLYADRAAKDTSGNGEEYNEPDIDRLILSLQQAGFFVDVMRFGLDTVVDHKSQNVEPIVNNARSRFRESYGKQLARHVEFYNESEYLYHSSLIENIIFGVPTDKAFALKSILENKDFYDFLNDNKLTQPLEELGCAITKETMGLLTGLDNPELISEHSPIPVSQFDRAEKALANYKKQKESDSDSRFFMVQAFNFTPAVHTMIALPVELKGKILEARKLLRKWAMEHFPKAFTFYNKDTYIEGQSLLNNIFFGRVKTGMAHAQEKINQAIMQLLIEEDALERVAYLGMQFDVGSSGDKLSGGQRQKLAIARVLLKSPSIIIMDEATSALDNASQARIQKLIDTRWKNKCTVIAVLHRMDDIASFDQIGVMKAGKLLETGSYQELIDKKGLFHELIFGK